MSSKVHSETTAAAVGYVRVSTKEQAEGGVSISAQRTAIESYCCMRGLRLAVIYEDSGVSGSITLDARPAGEVLVSAVADGARYVVAYKLDRLFRNTVDALQRSQAWDSAGVAMHLVDLGGVTVDTSTATGRFVMTVMAGCAEMEVARIRERTTDALRFKKARGLRAGQVPYGERIAATGRADGEGKGAVEPDPDEQHVLRRIAALSKRGHGSREIARRFNADGTPARGVRWHETTIRRILRRVA